VFLNYPIIHSPFSADKYKGQRYQDKGGYRMKNTFQSNDSVVFCKLYLENADEWVHGIITYIHLEKKIAEVFISQKNHRELLLKNESTVVIKSFSDENETLFTGHIERKVVSMRKQSLTIQIDAIMAFQNNRKHERFYVNYKCIIQDADLIEYHGMIRDLSLGGTLLLSDADFHELSSLQIHIMVSPTVEIQFKGKIIRKIQGPMHTRYGLQFEEIDGQNLAVLQELISYLKNLEHHLEDEWKVFSRFKKIIYSASIAIVFVIVFILFRSKAL
jgi:c-di-GMP-binding flagellar brake protein YcgR